MLISLHHLTLLQRAGSVKDSVAVWKKHFFLQTKPASEFLTEERLVTDDQVLLDLCAGYRVVQSNALTQRVTKHVSSRLNRLFGFVELEHHWLLFIVHLHNDGVDTHANRIDVLIDLNYHTVIHICLKVSVEGVFSHRPTTCFRFDVQVDLLPHTLIIKVVDWICGYKCNLTLVRHVRLGVSCSTSDEFILISIAKLGEVHRSIFLHVESKRIHCVICFSFINRCGRYSVACRWNRLGPTHSYHQ